MSAFALKLVALISMFIDHSTFVLYMHNFMNENIYILLRGIGRLAFPIYCFLLVNGFMHTSNRLRYVSRLMLFAVISQIPFALAFNVGNHYVAVFGAPEISFGSITYILLAFQFILAAIVICLWAAVQYGFTGANLVFFAFAALSLLPVLIYNGKKGPSLKYFFYIFYPAHLLLLGIAGLLL